ncbi:YppF family protein [Oceanobacillus senegalensis]|uniref:YppF family protein n=1 Tax=Oceanobacillus senegalensis TaxID=1936063 RepID=UPI000A30869C|nr:YppF family protein [Oceanobacillus senegalensis]
MLIHDLVDMFITERNHTPDSVNNLLDYFQYKYIAGEINIKDYRHIFTYLHKKGAVSAFEYIEERPIKQYHYSF